MHVASKFAIDMGRFDLNKDIIDSTAEREVNLGSHPGYSIVVSCTH